MPIVGAIPAAIFRRRDHRAALLFVRVKLNRAVRQGLITEEEATAHYEDAVESVEEAVKAGFDWMTIIMMILEMILEWFQNR